MTPQHNGPSSTLFRPGGRAGVERGILVDDRLQTSDPHIFALRGLRSGKVTCPSLQTLLPPPGAQPCSGRRPR